MQYHDYTDDAPRPAPAPNPMPAYVPPKSPGTLAAISAWFRGKGLTVGLMLAVALLGGIAAHDHWPHRPHVDPNPPPIPTPVAEPIRVIFAYESDDPMSKDQVDVLSSPKVRGYLTSHCLKDAGAPAWRFWDKDVDAAKETTSWQSAWTAAKADASPVPKVVIFTRAGMTVHPLPANEAATLELLKKYGGA